MGKISRRTVGRVAALAVVLLGGAGNAPAGGDPFAAAQAGVDWLLPATCAWMTNPSNLDTDCTDGTSQTCMGCHVQGEGTLALARSASRCYVPPSTACALAGDESLLEFTTRFVAGAQRKDCIIGPFACNGPRQDPTTTDGRFQNLGSIGGFEDCGAKDRRLDDPMTNTVHGGLALAGYSAWVSQRYSPNLVALSDWLVTQQDPGGRWILDQSLPPVSQGDSFATGASCMSLQAARVFAGPAQVSAYDAAIAAAVSWVRTAVRITNQDKVFGLLTLLIGGVGTGDPDYAALEQDLRDDQLADGGWAERVGLSSNAYATGQALFALHEAGVPFSDPAACAGIQWLVANQNASGSWSLGRRGVDTDSGHRSEFTATSWPVLVLGSLSRFDVNVLETPPLLTTCDPETAWTLTVRNTADDPCGLYPRIDTVTLDAVNASGDSVSVTPPTLALGVGEEATVTVRWTRIATRPGQTSTTSFTAASDGAAALGCPVVVARQLDVHVPAPDVPFGVALAPDLPRVATCDADRAWTIVVTNSAETPCGNIPSIDTIDLTATNDLGDVVSVVPPSVTLLSGETVDVVLSWTRAGAPRPPGTISTTTLRAASAGAQAAGSPIEATITRVTDTPAPVQRFGVVLDPEETISEGCEDERSWPATVTNTADDPCGAFPTFDTYELSASSDSGDPVSVVPATLWLASGASDVVTVTWRRAGAPLPAGSATTTTLRVVSAGARAEGATVEATAIFAQAIPQPPEPWAVAAQPPTGDVVACGPDASWPIVVRNATIDPCGLFPQTDVLELSATNDLGDLVAVTPPSVTLLQGEEATVSLSWTRAGAPRDPGVVSTTTFVAASANARLAGFAVEASATRTVTAPSDPVPAAELPGLRASRRGSDVMLRWDAHPDAVGGHELVALDCPARESCPERPTRGVLDARAALASTAPGQLDATLSGAAGPGTPGLTFYKVRAISECRGLPGPTCPYVCSDPDRCDATCP